MKLPTADNAGPNSQLSRYFAVHSIRNISGRVACAQNDVGKCSHEQQTNQRKLCHTFPHFQFQFSFLFSFVFDSVLVFFFCCCFFCCCCLPETILIWKLIWYIRLRRRRRRMRLPQPTGRALIYA